MEYIGTQYCINIVLILNISNHLPILVKLWMHIGNIFNAMLLKRNIVFINVYNKNPISLKYWFYFRLKEPTEGTAGIEKSSFLANGKVLFNILFIINSFESFRYLNLNIFNFNAQLTNIKLKLTFILADGILK